jgi:UDP-N-acetylmuramoyl-L-alanyl-D-glutamate--2,6-diaminopimelate ligase
MYSWKTAPMRYIKAGSPAWYTGEHYLVTSSHDHLDYHQTFDEYIRVKKSFFDNLPPTAFAISNADDKRGAVMLQNTVASKYFYSLKTMADFKERFLKIA